MNEIPNDGNTRFLYVFNDERMLLVSPKTLRQWKSLCTKLSSSQYHPN